MEKRKSVRFDEVEELKGKLYNVVNFRVKDISYIGLNLVCGLITKVGAVYVVYLSKEDKKKDFKIKIVRAEAHPFDEKYKDLHSDGMLFSIGAEFLDLTEDRKEFLDTLINEKVDLDGGFFLES